ATSHPAPTHQPDEELAVEPVLSLLTVKVRRQKLQLLVNVVRRQRNVEIRAAHVSVPFRELVLEDQMIPERVPGQFADQPVVLVEVVPSVREDELGVDARLEI